jgi:cell division septation protein DedD
MAGGSRGGDVVLGGRHLIGLFALLVVVLGIVFTLGYLLGRSRYEDASRIAAATPAAEPAALPPPPAVPAPAPGTVTPNSAGNATENSVAPPANWDFYKSGEPAKTAELSPAAAPPAVPPQPAAEPAKPAPAPAAKPAAAAARTTTPAGSALIPKGAVTLQVAALVRQADALALAQALQEKKFPTIVTTPSVDKYYRVQVGPYPDLKAATSARRELEKQGFKSIVRR